MMLKRSLAIGLNYSTVFSGASTNDLHAAPDIHVQAVDGGVVLTDARSGEQISLKTRERPYPGAKVTAAQVLALAWPPDWITRARTGGGAFNQAADFTQLIGSEDRSQCPLLIDSAPFHAETAATYRAVGFEILPTNRHARLVNLTCQYAVDKLTIRSPVVRATKPLASEGREWIEAAAAQAERVIVVSPKDVETTELLWNAAPDAVRYFQPTGSLPVEPTRRIADTAHGLACNGAELGLLAAAFGIDASAVDESAVTVAFAVAETLGRLAECALSSARAIAVTLGRRGVVVADREHGRMYAVEAVLRRGESGVPTRSGAGDQWNAAWIYQREVLRIPEPEAAAAATRHVAHFLGLEPDQFDCRITGLDYPVRRRGGTPRAIAQTFPAGPTAVSPPKTAASQWQIVPR